MPREPLPVQNIKQYCRGYLKNIFLNALLGFQRRVDCSLGEKQRMSRNSERYIVKARVCLRDLLIPGDLVELVL